MIVLPTAMALNYVSTPAMSFASPKPPLRSIACIHVLLFAAAPTSTGPPVPSVGAAGASSAIPSFSHGLRLRGILSGCDILASRTVLGISSIPGMGWLRVIRSTIEAKEVGYGGWVSGGDGDGDGDVTGGRDGREFEI